MKNNTFNLKAFVLILALILGGFYSVSIVSADPGSGEQPPIVIINPPVIKLVGDAHIFIAATKVFEDPGATAQDYEDHDLTPFIVVSGSVDTNVAGDYTLTYSVEQNGLSASVERVVTVVAENRAPMVRLNGESTMNLLAGQVFEDPGATAFDEEDGELDPATIAVSGDTVDVNAPATYTIKYSVTDSDGLSSELAIRTVNILENEIIVPAPPVVQPEPERGSHGSSGSRARKSAVTPVGEVLGAENFKFLSNLREGMTGNDVVELQKRLRAEGFFTFPTNTGFFGPITKNAVRAYQTAHPEIGYVTGFFGPLTRGVINK